MKKSFYHYVQKYRGGGTRKEWTTFANALFHDNAFPKQSTDYDELSSYLEMNEFTNNTLRTFDELWEIYLEEN